ncbi:MAG: ATP-binding protein, partial [Acidobacteria bacterium]|nr:ATP-binding protein [Acidobacteriota bacterium]
IPFDQVRQNAHLIQDQLHRATEKETLRTAEHLAGEDQLQTVLSGDRRAELQYLLSHWLTKYELERMACFSFQGQLLASASKNGTQAEKISSVFSAADLEVLAPSGIRVRTSEQGPRTYWSAAQILGPGNFKIGTLVVAKTLPFLVNQARHKIQKEVQHYEALNQEHIYVRRVYLWVLSLITLLLLFAATWGALFLSKQITVPIQALAEATQEVSRGNLGHQVETPAGEELAALIRSFNAMTRQLLENRRVIEQSTEELRHANRELEEQGRYRQVVLRNIPAGVIALDRKAQVREMNGAMERMVGTAGRRPSASLEFLFGREQAGEIIHLLRRADRQGVVMRQTELELPGGKIPVALTASTIQAAHRDLGYVLVVEDLTELVKVQKATAWREIAQRIAHEIKNPLTPIRLSAERIQRLLERTHEGNLPPRVAASLKDCGALILQETDTLQSLVDEFSRFARLPAAKPVPSNFNSLVQSGLAVFDGRLEGIRIHTDFSPDLPIVWVDPDQIKRLLINLVDNAAEALSDALVKEIWVKTALDTERDMVELIVADTGPGVTLPVKERLFLPYFSTKRRGTGLGLSIVSRIVTDHNGSVRVEENRPTGAKFIIEIPLDHKRAARAKSAMEAASGPRRNLTA